MRRQIWAHRNLFQEGGAPVGAVHRERHGYTGASAVDRPDSQDPQGATIGASDQCQGVLVVPLLAGDNKIKGLDRFAL